MFWNQSLKAPLGAGLLLLSLGLAGCASSTSMARADNTASTAPTADAAAPVQPQLTATQAAIRNANSTRADRAQPAAQPVLNRNVIKPNAPRRYTVKRGDTLWDIASTFLRDPWLWPEIWYVNPQIRNPHLIYPGDVLVLAYGSNGRPQIRLQRGGSSGSGGSSTLGAVRLEPRLRSTPIASAIPTIPYAAIAAFLSHPALLTARQVRRAPHIVAIRNSHVIAGTGNDVYVTHLDAPLNTRFTVMHVGEALRDPDTGDVLGYKGVYTATAVVTRPGDPATAVLLDSARETVDGDRLFSTETSTPLHFMPHAPSQDVRGRIISVVDGVDVIGQFQIVALNRGTSQGVGTGTVLAVDQAGQVVRDTASRSLGNEVLGAAFAPRVKLPDERAGLLMVFKAYPRLSYALVVGAIAPMHIGDVVHNP